MEIYLDNSATTKTCKPAIEACINAMEVEFGNPSSLHEKGFKAEKIVDEAKKTIGLALKCAPNEIMFTSGATEANNLALFGVAEAGKRKGNRIITTAIEHPSVLEVMTALEKQGFEVVRLKPDSDGSYSEWDFYNAVDSKTILVSCMMVNNETGLILPVSKIAEAVKRKNPDTIVHVDAVQGFLKLPIKLRGSMIDLLSISGHKVNAPKGVGALYIKRGVRILPMMFGGSQQNGLRPGTESVPIIAAFGAAVEYQSKSGAIENRYAEYSCLREQLLSQLNLIREVKINSKPNAAPHILNLSVEGIRSEVLLHFLEQYEIYVSSGSACAKGKQSHVLSALGSDRQTVDTAIRVSFSDNTTKEQLDTFVYRLKEGINSLARIKV